MTQIIDAYLGLVALRQAGYRSTATAVAELIDNSLEAKAVNIDIIAISNKVVINQRASNQVHSIAVLDNGDGMPSNVLQKCLSLGWGTRLDTRGGLGRFGFGLKGASISQARRVDVYSWQEDGEVFKAYMDLEEIKSGSLQTLPNVEKSAIPPIIEKAFKASIGSSGTLIVWNNLDQMDLRRADTLLNRINKDLCRVYRHFLDNDNDYGTKRYITLHMLQSERGKIERSIALKANDPLYLLTPSNLPKYENEQTNVLHDEVFKLPIKYFDGVKEAISEIEFRFSIAKPTIQNLMGSSDVGRHYANNTGISFVRAGREIDFGSFGFLDRSESRHRWWGIEVRFEPVLDELFGVTNNKQEVRSIRKLDDDLLSEMNENIEHTNGENYKDVLLVEINKIFKDHITDMMRIIKGRREGVSKKRIKKGVTTKVNADMSVDSSPTESEDRSKKLTLEEKVQERAKLLLEDDTSLSEEEAKQVAEETIDYRVDIQTGDWPGELFLDRRPVAHASVGIINRRSRFYEDFWNYLDEHSDRKGFEAMEILIMAFVRSEDELVKEYDRKIFDRFRSRWGYWVERLIGHAGS